MPEAPLLIESIAAGGDGVARDGKLVVFVPRTAPGDRAEVIYEVKGGLGRGYLRSIIAPSVERADPRCIHYTRDRCGGCQLQHISYEGQLRAKVQIVRDALRRIGGRTFGDISIQPSPRRWNYRRKLTLALRHIDDRWTAGLHAYDNPRDVFSLSECPITDAAVLAVWKEVMAQSDNLPRALSLRASVTILEGAHLSVEGGTEWKSASALATLCPSLRSIWWTPHHGKRRMMLSSHSGAGASFVQVNREVAQLLRTHVLGTTAAHHPASAIDAYAGRGEYTLGLSEQGIRCTAIEQDADAVALLAAALPSGSSAVAGRVEERIREFLPADVVILNPPRSGLDRAVSETLNSPGCVGSALIYVSCDPATMARDIARMNTLRLKTVSAFDMFPQTSHVEVVCELVPADLT
jgi:23S rRNA (uracil1939-C5)-methyltransferase